MNGERIPDRILKKKRNHLRRNAKVAEGIGESPSLLPSSCPLTSLPPVSVNDLPGCITIRCANDPAPGLALTSFKDMNNHHPDASNESTMALDTPQPAVGPFYLDENLNREVSEEGAVASPTFSVVDASTNSAGPLASNSLSSRSPAFNLPEVFNTDITSNTNPSVLHKTTDVTRADDVFDLQSLSSMDYAILDMFNDSFEVTRPGRNSNSTPFGLEHGTDYLWQSSSLLPSPINQLWLQGTMLFLQLLHDVDTIWQLMPCLTQYFPLSVHLTIKF